MRQHIINIATEFWKLAGGVTKWPCDIERAVSILTPLNIVSLSDLNFNKINHWFHSRNIPVEVEMSNRILHGFISVHKNSGFIFINGTDSESERRYTVSHEVSHYFLDYKLPREKAIRIFGESITDVLDGYREPTGSEKVESVLAAITIKPFMHILEADGDGTFARYNNWLSEKDADLLGIELMAPYKLVRKDFSKYLKKPVDFEQSKSILTEILQTKYDLPVSISIEYASSLAAGLVGSKSIIDRLGLRNE